MVGVTPPLVPYTPIYRRYRDTTALDDKQRLACAKHLSAHPEILADEFAQSVQLMADRYANAMPFRPAPKVPREPRQPGIRNGTDFAWYLHRQRTLPVLDDPTLDVAYADYELSILSTRGRAVFDHDLTTKAGRALRADLVLRALADDYPVISEVKLNRDKEPFSGLVQLLAYIAHLATPTQYNRLRRYVPGGHYPPADRPVFDGYVLLYRFGESPATYLDGLLEQAMRSSAALMSEPTVTRHIRRLACVDVVFDADADGRPGGPLSATVRWRHDAAA